jgi:hypothetical protein
MNGSVNISSPDSDVEVKVQEVRLELEETYGKQITVMKEELSKHYQAQIETLSCELNNVKQVCATLETSESGLEILTDPFMLACFRNSSASDIRLLTTLALSSSFCRDISYDVLRPIYSVDIALTFSDS